MYRIAVVCLPDLIFAIPTMDVDDDKTESSISPTRSHVKGNPSPAWMLFVSEELETDSKDYGYFKRLLCFGQSPEGEDSWYMERLQTVIKNAFANLKALEDSKDKSGS
jgi:hypothetical protein